MGENTKIQWADHTFNPWVGCQKVSAACDMCYAETLMDKRLGRVEWGPGKQRVRTSPSNWRLPHRWDRKAAARGQKARVFCASLADVFDNAVPEAWRQDLWHLIYETPNLIWMLLTKRPQNIAKMLPITAADFDIRERVWLGTTTEDQEAADRNIPELLRNRAAVHFISCEPLLGPIVFQPHWLEASAERVVARILPNGDRLYRDVPLNHLRWVIVGGESGQNARPMHPQWARDIRDQCRAASVAFHFKQWGEYISCQLDRRRTGPPHWGMPDALWQDGHEGFRFDRHKRPSMKFIGWTPDGQPWPAGTEEEQEEYRARFGAPECVSLCIGKKAAGRKLDGRTWDEIPAMAG